MEDCIHKYENDAATGTSYCINCGEVLTENNISAEISFVEGNDGSARMVGQFVSADRSGLRSLNMRNRRLNTGESREETIANAKRRFHEIAISLKGLSDYHTDRALQAYKLALLHSFTKGRKQPHVLAACLYIVCRQEKTNHMLLDFSDVLHTNVYTLGNTFLALSRLLEVRLPIIDPSIYIARFAAELEFESKTHAVAMDAMRLVQRMRRDWIAIGRRPSGICGAALIVAGRMHGFQRSQSDVIRIVKICDVTLRKRLNEFANTPSASLTIEEFRSTDLSEESNPPCFQQSKRKTITEKPAHEIHDQHTAPLNEDDLNEEISHVLKTELAAPFHKWVTSEVDPDPANWTDLNDNEMDGMILQKDEVMAKTELWEEMNQDWITLQQQKAVVAEKSDNSADAHSAKRRKKGVPALNRDGTIKVVQADVTGKRSRKIVVNSPADATREVLERKLAPRLSRKLNYKALDSLFSK